VDTTKAETMVSGLVPKKGGNYGTCRGYVGIDTKKEDLKKKTSAKKQVSHSIQRAYPLSK
jgi:hypothetical protein